MDGKLESNRLPSLTIGESAIASALSISTGLFSLMSLSALVMWIYIGVGGSSNATVTAITLNVVIHLTCGSLFIPAFFAARSKNSKRAAKMFALGLFAFCALSMLADVVSS